MLKRATSLIFCGAIVVVLMAPNRTLYGSRADQEEERWSYIGTSKERVKLSYSPEKTIKRGKLIQAWFKGEHPNSDEKISSNISLHEFNCPKGTYRLLQGTLFFRDGSARTSNQSSAWEYPLPNSIAEMEFRQICRKTSSHKKQLAVMTPYADSDSTRSIQ